MSSEKNINNEPDHTGDKEFLTARAIRFFSRYGVELEQIASLLAIRLNQLALAYTIQNKLPRESVIITTRVKTLKSFLKKIQREGWPHFYYLKDIVNDLIGARVTCWFLDDCYGMYDYIKQNNQFTIISEMAKDYISNPKKSGYRSIHVIAKLYYDRVKSEEGQIKIEPEYMNCEIQIRTKLMDTWADLTHEFHYKAKDMGLDDQQFEKIVKTQSDRLYSEDEAFMAIRDVYQKMIARTDKPDREGFADEKSK
jgi:GTP pyrophosphokinase